MARKPCRLRDLKINQLFNQIALTIPATSAILSLSPLLATEPNVPMTTTPVIDSLNDIDFSINGLLANRAPLKQIKISSARGRTLYNVGKWSVSVTRKTITTKRGCGLRNNTSVCDWYAIDRQDPVAGKSFSGYGGIRDAVAKLIKISAQA